MFILVFVCVLFTLIPIVCIIHYLRLKYDNETVIQGNDKVGNNTERIKTLKSYKKK